MYYSHIRLISLVMPFVLGEVAEVEVSSSVLPLLPTNPARHHYSLKKRQEEAYLLIDPAFEFFVIIK